MSVDTSSWDDFKKRLHQIFLHNELTGSDEEAYKINHAGTDESGYSYGFNQMDLANNSTARSTLQDIMENAKDDDNELIVGLVEKDAIKNEWTAKGDLEAFTEEQKELLNSALQSAYGKEKVESLYLEELERIIERVDDVVASVSDTLDKSYLENNDVGRLFLADYHNQYDLSINGKLNKYVKGQAVTTSGAGPLVKDAVLDWEDLMRYYKNTKYSQDHADDSKRRARRIVDESSLNTVEKSEHKDTIDGVFDGIEEASGIEATNDPVSLVVNMTFPIDLGNGYDLTDKNIAEYYKHVEKGHKGGYFPIGSNTMWHGGIHVHSKKGSDIQVIADGEIVAVRLAEEDKAIGAYGSHNFILIKHIIKGARLNRQFNMLDDTSVEKFSDATVNVFYSLYMHLNTEVLDDSNDRLKNFLWLPVTEETSEVSSPDTHTVTEGESLQSIALAWEASIQDIRDKNPELESHFGQNGSGTVAWYRPGDIVKRPNIITKNKIIKKEFLDALKTGEVQKLKNVFVESKDALWSCGEYGSEPAGLMHWEIISGENLLPSFISTEDPDQDWNMDVKSIFDLVEQEDSWFDDADNVDAEELSEFYANNEAAESLRKYSCKFLSEWAMDLDIAIPNLKGRFITYGLKKRIEPYVWWDKAIAGEVDLPSSKHVWHYNPIAFSEMLGRGGQIFTLPYAEDHIPKTTANSRRPGTSMTPIYLTIHSTGNPNSTAKNERNWLTNAQNTVTASYHIVVDEIEAIECIPFDEKAYHAGDGGGIGNTQTIGLEICESGDRVETLKNAISLSAKILTDYGWDESKLRQHNDWSGKNCPRILRQPDVRGGEASQTWDWFKGEVAKLL